jgi:flagella basal body P-ring formation protein FlgA
MRKVCWGFIAFFLIAKVFAAVPASFEDPEHIKKLVTEYITKAYEQSTKGKVSVKLVNIDSRLKLSACTEPLNITLPQSEQQYTGSYKLTSVSCEKPVKWQIYIPVNLQLMIKVAVLAQGVNRGDLLSPQNVKMSEVDVMQLHDGYFMSVDNVLGKIANTTLQAENVLSPRNIKTPPVITRGQTVIIESRSGGVVVEINGVAAEDGAVGDNISVLNQSSNQPVHATVIGPRRVKVGL